MASENETMKSPLYGEAGRTKSRKNKGPKKTPQRGLGVEQLERMRAEETLKKMAEASGGFHIDHPYHLHHQQALLRYGALSSNAPFHFPQQQMIINENNNNNNSTIVGGSAFNPFITGNKTVFGVETCSNVASGVFVPNNQLSYKPNHFGSGSLLVRNPLEPSKELSSMPNHYSQCLDLCLKKTRFNEEENVMRGKNVHDFHFHNKLFKHDESVEVVAVHRRGKSSSGNGRVFMEYEFFPRKDGRDTTSKEQEFSTIDFVFGEGSSSSSITFTTPPYGVDSSTNGYDSIDLSLKL